MKSVIALFAALAVASVATADFAVELTNDAGYEATFPQTQYTVQIIQNDGTAATSVDAGSLLGSGDNLVTSFTTGVGYAGTFGSASGQGQVVTSSAGTAGEIVVRLFELGAGVGAVGSQWTIASGTFDVYNAQDISTIYTVNGVIDSGFTLGSSGTAVSVIPEPATIGLLGIAGAGLYAARRKNIA